MAGVAPTSISLFGRVVPFWVIPICVCMGCQFRRSAGLLQTDTAAAESEDSAPAGRAVTRYKIPGGGGVGEAGHRNRSIPTPSVARSDDCATKDPCPGDNESGVADSPRGSADYIGDGRRRIKRAMGDSASLEREAETPTCKRRAPVICGKGGAGIYKGDTGFLSPRKEIRDAHERDVAIIASLSPEKRKYDRSKLPMKRAMQSRTGIPTRSTSGKHKFNTRGVGQRPARIYSTLLRTWKSVPALADVAGRGPVRRGWIQVARVCRDEMLCAAGGEAAGGAPFLIVTEDSKMPDNDGGGRVVFSCRSHATNDNYRCRAAWQFKVLRICADFFDVTVLCPATNEHGEIETDEYQSHRLSMLTRYYADMAMGMGDAACTSAKVSELAFGNGGWINRSARS